MRGSQLHDEIGYDREERRFTRYSNNSGGTEGGMTTGEPIRVRVAFKPLSTLMRPLRSADIKSKAEAVGAIERSDVCAIPAAAVIAEAVVAFELADGISGKIRRRFIRRNHAQLPGLPGTGPQLLSRHAAGMPPKLILTGFMANRQERGRARASRGASRGALIDSDERVLSRARANRSPRFSKAKAKPNSASSNAKLSPSSRAAFRCARCPAIRCPRLSRPEAAR